jgi:hypothetical protein
LEAILKNVGNEAVYFVDAAAFDIRMYELTVLLPNGEKAPLTLYGKRYCERRGEGSAMSSMFQPGEEKGTQFALSRLFDFSRSGKYTVSIKRTLFSKIMQKVESNELEITVKDGGRPFYIVRKESDLHGPPKEVRKE